MSTCLQKVLLTYFYFKYLSIAHLSFNTTLNLLTAPIKLPNVIIECKSTLCLSINK